MARKIENTNIKITDEILKSLCASTSSPKQLIRHVLHIKGMSNAEFGEAMGKTQYYAAMILLERVSLGSKALYEACIALDLNPVIVFHKWSEWMLEKEKKKHS